MSSRNHGDGHPRPLNQSSFVDDDQQNLRAVLEKIFFKSGEERAEGREGRRILLMALPCFHPAAMVPMHREMD